MPSGCATRAIRNAPLATHSHVELPIVVAGGGSGTVKGGRHIRYAEPTPLANLHLTLLEKVGVRLDAFADSKGRVDELLTL